MRGNFFVYYKSDEEPAPGTPPQGQIDVTDCKCVPTENDGKSKWKFNLEDKNNRVWNLYVESDKARNQWVNALRKISTGETLQGQLGALEKIEGGEDTSLSAKFGLGKGQKNSKKTSSTKNINKSSPTFTRGEKTQKQNTSITENTSQPSPYLIKELNSPPIRSSSIYGPKLKFEEEELKKDAEAKIIGAEKKAAGGDEMDSDDNDFLETEEAGAISKCTQQ